jgi:signal transduction histidine kinase
MSVTAPELQEPVVAPRLARLRTAGRTRYALECILLAALYFGSAKLGFALEFAGPVAAVVWLPVGVGISYLYFRGPELWPGLLAGDLLSNNYMAVPATTAIGTTVGNLLEVILGAIVLRRLTRRYGDPLGSVESVGRMCLTFAGVTMVSATLGTISSRLGGVVTTGGIPAVWRTWWLGDACGALIVVPLALAWVGPFRGVTRRRGLEGVVMMAATAGLAYLATSTPRALAYLAFPGLIWAALRFGRRGATLAILVVAGITIWNTRHVNGPFHYHSITRSVLSTQLFIAVAALSTLSLAAVVAERERFTASLAESRAQLLRAADAERRRLERNLHDGAQQRLLALAVRLRLAATRVVAEPDTGPGMFEDAERELQVAIDELRELSHGTHPTVLTDLGLATAIRSAAARSPQTINLLELPTERVDADAEAIAYFVFMEAIANAQRHAPGSTVDVGVHASPNALLVTVRDDGPGGAQETSGGGLRGLRDRVEVARGSFVLDSARGRGTRISVYLPLARSARP